MDDEFVRGLTNGRGLLRATDIHATGLVFLAADTVDRWAGLFGYEDASVLVLLHVGFVRHDVAAVEVDDGRRLRTVTVASPSGAFAALIIGDGSSAWRYIDRLGETVDEDTYTPL